ncbi:MAG TPA: PASTA domain-containing protein [Chitinophagaceae bacterium]|nr:PASTA domain-containing protein [Chitinophagaceae bacterium]MCC6635143.1 PASTA domain-containing protein [Chitinophagaceae bacterium]HMZ45726.1 PASTA domain-containing protein [Chitinophagaceae bacterium]HNJ57552.1 PASTA domain-containing protein [Chitinophagaceae bacterium]HNM35274.1 PASTA domain-containing protein [Chitinophagaceae bacterium]
MKLFKFITDKPLWVNIVVAITLLMVLIFIFFISLKSITSHGESIKVPNTLGQNITAAQKMLESQGFSVEVLDSVFIDTIARLSVFKQSPEADVVVKKGRTIYLTVNKAIAPEVEMPSLIGYSYKSAELMLQSLSLKMGDTSYKADFARNSVLEQYYNRKPIKEGTKIPMGSTISFVLGSGVGNTDINVPNLLGLKVSEALGILQNLHLNVGPIIAQEAISDTLNAFVTEQRPPAFSEPTPGQKVQNKLRAGQVIDLFIRNTPITVQDSTITQ